MHRRIKAILVDIIGFTLIIAAIPISWLPGPGGIPILIIGLSLLANNHEWAERILEHIKTQGGNLLDKFFSGSAKMKWFVDLASVAFIAIAVILLELLTPNIKYTIGIALIISGTFLFLGNRRRYQRFWEKIKLTKHKN